MRPSLHPPPSNAQAAPHQPPPRGDGGSTLPLQAFRYALQEGPHSHWALLVFRAGTENVFACNIGNCSFLLNERPSGRGVPNVHGTAAREVRVSPYREPGAFISGYGTARFASRQESRSGRILGTRRT